MVRAAIRSGRAAPPDSTRPHSVVVAVFLPPTFVASIYGMNFDFMPELHGTVGYPFALGLMVIPAIVPYAFFKRSGWL
jgi:magnesium transporter